MTGEELKKLIDDRRYGLRVDQKEVIDPLAEVLRVTSRTVHKWLEKNSVPMKYNRDIEQFFGLRTQDTHKGGVGESLTENMQGGNDLRGMVNNNLTQAGDEDNEGHNPYREIEKAILKLLDLDRMTELINHGAGKVQEAFNYAFRQVYKGAVYRIRLVVYVEKEEEEDTPLAPSPSSGESEE